MSYCNKKSGLGNFPISEVIVKLITAVPDPIRPGWSSTVELSHSLPPLFCCHLNSQLSPLALSEAAQKEAPTERLVLHDKHPHADGTVGLLADSQRHRLLPSCLACVLYKV